jgi:hypothetical protein
MPFDTIKVYTYQLDASSPTAAQGSNHISNLSQTIASSVADLATDLTAVDLLNGVASSLEGYNSGLLATLACYATGLSIIASGLERAAGEFQWLDGQLAATFRNLELQLPYYTGYETQVHLPTIPAISSTSTMNFHLDTISLQTPHHSPSAWDHFTSGVDTVWDDTGGQVVHAVNSAGQWVSDHRDGVLQVAVVAGVVTLIVISDGTATPIVAAAG